MLLLCVACWHGRYAGGQAADGCRRGGQAAVGCRGRLAVVLLPAVVLAALLVVVLLLGWLPVLLLPL